MRDFVRNVWMRKSSRSAGLRRTALRRMAASTILDVNEKTWESGMDEGIRHDQRPTEPSAAMDASAQVFILYEHAARGSRVLGKWHAEWGAKARALQQIMRTLPLRMSVVLSRRPPAQPSGREDSLA